MSLFASIREDVRSVFERDPAATPADIDHFVSDLKERVRHKLKNDTAVNFEVEILPPNTLERALSAP